MKVLSLWQPWATLMANGLKKNETRSWGTDYRGPLAIHAAQKVGLDQQATWRAFQRSGIVGSLANVPFTDLPRGGIIATLNLVDCIPITEDNCPDEPELSFGDYKTGRFMWITDNPRPLKKIIPLRGYQRLFEVPDEVLRVCRICGCSEYNACENGCFWVEEDLCSECVNKGINLKNKQSLLQIIDSSKVLK
jgi:hypothetical protein